MTSSLTYTPLLALAQFYFVYPLLLAWAYRSRVVQSAGASSARTDARDAGTRPVAIFGGALVLSLLASAALSALQPTWAFYRACPAPAMQLYFELVARPVGSLSLFPDTLTHA